MIGGGGEDGDGDGDREGRVRGRRQEQWREPAFQVIVLGSGGGPVEDNVTGFLVRSTATNWTKGSVLAVDAGTHLAAIVRILEAYSETSQEDGFTSEVPSEVARPSRNPRRLGNGVAAATRSSHREHHPGVKKSSGLNDNEKGVRVSNGPFAGMKLPFKNARTNAAYFTRELVSTFLITHPHLDHISGFVINTASFQQTTRPKRLAALSSTIDAIKSHIFNDVIWPNLSDEEGGVGLISYMRLVEGGNVAIGQGDGTGYIEVCEGLGVKGWMVSHGSCMKKVDPARSSVGSNDQSQVSAATTAFSQARTPSIEYDRKGSSSSYHHRNPSIGTVMNSGPMRIPSVYDSTAYFIRDDHSGKEILIFGDVEPDSISSSPRTGLLWDQAAPKIVAGTLRGIFIECSYDDSQSDDTLFGHLAPRHLVAELRFLAKRVLALRGDEQQSRQSQMQVQTTTSKRKRKRERGESLNGRDSPLPSSSDSTQHGQAQQPTTAPDLLLDPTLPSPPRLRARPRRTRSRGKGRGRRKEGPYSDLSLSPSPQTRQISTSNSKSDQDQGNQPIQHPPPPPLNGLEIIIIHMKDPLKDATDREGGLTIEQSILTQLEAHERNEKPRLGCRFRTSTSGEAIWL